MKKFFLPFIMLMTAAKSSLNNSDNVHTNSRQKTSNKKALRWLRMKQSIVSYSLLAFVLLTGNSQQAAAQTTLAQGDISIVGVNSNSYGSTGVNQGLAFVCWVNVSNGTTIKFSLNSFNSTSSSNSSANANTSNNQTVYWNNNTGSTISAGTVITIGGISTSAMTTNVGTISAYGTSGYGGNGSFFTPGNGGRALFAFQYGSTSDYSASSSTTATFNGTLLYGLCWAGNIGSNTWLTSGSSSSNRSYQPSDLGSSNQISGLGASVKYAAYTGATSGFATLSALKTAVNNVSNWTAGTSLSGHATFPGNFTIPSLNTAPTFTSGTTTLTLCQSASATAVNSLLTVSDVDASQTET